MFDQRYLESLRGGDEWQAVQWARGLIGRGVPVEAVLADLVGHGQRQVGDAWLTGRWSVAEEHVATSVSERVEAALVADAIADRAPETTLRRQVLVACAEGEKHTLPARMVADRLRLAGLSVVFLGLCDSGQLREIVREWRPDAVVLSCTMAFNFLGVLRSMSALSDAGSPVFIGGRAVRSRAVAGQLGTDRWARDVDQLVDLIQADHSHEGPQPREAPSDEPFVIERRMRELSAVALHALLRRSDRVPPPDAWALAAAGESLENLLRTAGAALLVGDPTIFDEQLAWSDRYLRFRGETADVLAASLGAVVSTCDAELRHTAALLTDAIDRRPRLPVEGS